MNNIDQILKLLNAFNEGGSIKPKGKDHEHRIQAILVQADTPVRFKPLQLVTPSRIYRLNTKIRIQVSDKRSCLII